MKRIVSLILAAILVTGIMTTMSSAADAPVLYPVGSISDAGYLMDDDDSLVDLSNPTNDIAYGDTIYFPLLNSSAKDALKTAYDNDQAAQKGYDTAASSITELLRAKESAQAVFAANKTAAQTKADQAAAIATALQQLARARQTLADATDALAKAAGALVAYPSEAQTAAQNFARLLTAYENIIDDNNSQLAAYLANPSDTPAPNAAVSDLGDAILLLSPTSPNVAGAQTAAQTILNLISEKETATDLVSTASTSVSQAEATVRTAGYEGELPNDLSILQSQYTTASTVQDQAVPGYESYQSALSDYNTAVDALAKLKMARDSAHAEYQRLQNAAASYPFVYEYDATKGIRIKTDWDTGNSFVTSVSIVKKRYTGSTFASAAIGAQRSIYFLAIQTKRRTTTSSVEVVGTISLKKGGVNGFDYKDVGLDLFLTLGHGHASDGKGANLIPEKPALFEAGVDFDENTDEEFEFEVDSDSRFVTDTNGQGKLVLGMNANYDEEIADRFSNANLDFWNGNGASFNKIGDLYLAADEDHYVYRVNTDGFLTALPTTAYDDYENAFVIHTRTLGRYVISDIKLDLSKQPILGGSTESAGSAGSGSSTTVTVVEGPLSNSIFNPQTGGFGYDGKGAGTTPMLSTAFLQSISDEKAHEITVSTLKIEQSNLTSDSTKFHDYTPAIMGNGMDLRLLGMAISAAFAAVCLLLILSISIATPRNRRR